VLTKPAAQLKQDSDVAEESAVLYVATTHSEEDCEVVEYAMVL